VVRAAAVVLLVAALALVASGIAWVRATGTRSTPGDPEALLEDLGRPVADIDVGSRYAGRAELVDPRTALPRWHAAPRAQAAAVFLATRTCGTAKPSIDITDAALAKALAWHERSCAKDADLSDLLARPPFMHPSGHSYAALAIARGANGANDPKNAGGLHVLEVGAPDVLATIPTTGWESLARGDRLILTKTSLIVADRGAFGIGHLKWFDRASFDERARRVSLALVPRPPSAACAHPASSVLCWETVTSAERHRGALAAATAASSGVALFAALGLAIAWRNERKRVNADRLHVLRTLTHELRTPATSLGLDIEPLRAAYDEMPASCQEPLLRISDGIERLNRVLHRTARYLELFERTTTLDARKREVSAKEAFAEMSEEWPEGVTLESPDVDAKMNVDVEWLSVAVRNLAENAVRHGKPPAVVSWRVENGELVVRVRDAGESAGLVVEPHRRDPSSPGLGLGLAIVHRVAELLGGTLVHEPSPTTFVFRIPA
jgi:signal transduction histidine kinase